ncbi:GM26774 [Drosophila sechellia]|uniref:GM26774 n=2 Tax=Drosophila sechellia TaxID=7238 RepID=B4IE82_DROSE|nr:GM26774 [Drosophila sechellia]
MAYNELNLLQRADISSGSTSEPVIRNGTSSEDGPALRQGTYTPFEKQILRLLRRLGIYDSFTVRVFKAIFSDEEQLKKLKKKLDELGKKDKDTDKDNDKDLLWAHIIDLF